jgi:hypothetical protein
VFFGIFFPLTEENYITRGESIEFTWDRLKEEVFVLEKEDFDKEWL